MIFLRFTKLKHAGIRNCDFPSLWVMTWKICNTICLLRFWFVCCDGFLYYHTMRWPVGMQLLTLALHGMGWRCKVSQGWFGHRLVGFGKGKEEYGGGSLRTHTELHSSSLRPKTWSTLNALENLHEGWMNTSSVPQCDLILLVFVQY